MSETRDTIAKWADDTFGPATDAARIGRALEEANEAADEIHDPVGCLVEIADVIICLCACPSSVGIDARGLVGDRAWQAVEAKMNINRSRKWILRGDGNGDHA